MARIWVSTARRCLIDEVVNLKVVGANYRLWVVEEGGRRWCTRLGRGVSEDDVTSVGSREGEVVGEERLIFSDDEVDTPKSPNSVHLWID